MREELLPVRHLLEDRSGIVALDIGANKGFWAKALLNMCGDRVHRIIMAEPSPENCNELARHDDNLVFAPTDFSKIDAHQFSLRSREGRTTLYTNEDGSPLAEIDLSVALDVEVTTVDAAREPGPSTYRHHEDRC
jgi:FkbM family methyltransferase